MAILSGQAKWAKGGRLEDDRFPDPFCDMASLAMPETIQDSHRWCEYIVMANGPYRAALSRVISYFITDIEISSPDGNERIGREEKQKYEDFLNDTVGIKSVLAKVALDYLCYGNSFTSVLVPFRRYLSCKTQGCGHEAPLRRVYNTPKYKFNWTNYEFHATCPMCKRSGTWRHIDRRASDDGKVKVKRWSPHYMDILHDPHTDDTAYIWKIPDYYREMIRRGRLFHLERASWEIIQAVKNNEALMFDDDVVYHMREDPLAGIDDGGWGISRVLANFRQAWYVQVLQRYNEAIALDYVIPFRVITPMPRPGQGGEVNDPVLTINMASFTARVNKMLQQRRRDPARWNILPFPIEYQALGGDATQLAPKDLLELGMDTLLTSIGVPVDLYKGSLTVQAAPAALRLFEANWGHLVHQLNRFLAKLVDRISQIMSWEPVTAKLQRVTHADDLNRQMAKLQLMMGGQISRTTGLGSVDIDFGEEEQLKVEEERTTAEITADAQKEMEQEAAIEDMVAQQQMSAPAGPAPGQPGGPQQMSFGGMPGAVPGGGMPAPAPASGGGGAAPPMGQMGMPMGPYGAVQSFMAGQPILPNQPITLEELQAVAGTLAQQAMTLPEGQKDSFLIQLKKENEAVHALVKSQIDEIRRDMKNQGGAMLMEQQKQASTLAMEYSNRKRPLRYIDLNQ